MNLFNLFKIVLKVPNFLFIKKILRHEIPIEDFDYSISKKQLYLKRLKVSVHKDKNLFVLNGYNLIINLIEKCNAQIISSDDGLLIKIDNLKFNINYWDELNILKEVFVDGIYNYVINENMSLIDIGMNVAITSLFFAKNDKIEKIYAFEPFPKTFNYAIKNIELNNHLAHKIIPRNYGLDKENQFLDVKYIVENKGSVGVKGIPKDLLATYKSNIQIERIELRSGLNEIKTILNENPYSNFIAKIDCEGSEYVIIDELHEKKVLRRIKVFIIEWHEKGPSQIIKTLNVNGFDVFSFGDCNKDVGMIYAFRK
ncbi:MAG: FkbM family methyltransferase [Hydrotalea sp. AMD]|uniref:FkbM family methyltransferase n=1 Tax=Hydrotalea sp. AMD TaxID=2501297 RepID=UPI0009440AFA|nr:FkbM family methyltransferase [Hydrotalea sp. AMD]RWZ88328.1 MAG: FkbM family methyltransferase [Hydrotalea sp. AMD]